MIGSEKKKNWIENVVRVTSSAVSSVKDGNLKTNKYIYIYIYTHTYIYNVYVYNVYNIHIIYIIYNMYIYTLIYTI